MLAREGQWDAAHRLVQEAGDPLSCLIHGYLHRVEGDPGNAAYWYRCAGEEVGDNGLQEEWARLAALVDEQAGRGEPPR
jgi:hypothetical protein